MKNLISTIFIVLTLSIQLFSQSNKSIIPIVADTSIQKQRINTFSLILEVGKSNIFNGLHTLYADGYFRDISGSTQRINKMYEISMEGNLSYSVGLSINHKLNSLSKKVFKRNSKSFFSLKYELLYNELNFNQVATISNPIGTVPIPSLSRFGFFAKNQPINISSYEFSPSILINKNIRSNTNLIFSFGPEILIFGSPDRSALSNTPKIVTFNDFLSMNFGWGVHGAVGIGYKNLSVSLKYQTSVINKPRPFPAYENEGILNYYKNDAYFESLNLSTEIIF